jgi:energy-coupling factor transport system substrate-specific component
MKNWIKSILIFLSIFAIRLIPFRAPNVEPIMASIMPLGKKYGGIFAFSFAFLSILIFDIFTSGIGLWTLITGLAYGFIGLTSSFFFKNRSGRKNYVIYAIVATIFYDVVTGLTIGPLFFNLPFMVALVGQIPFTILHLLGNVSFAIVLSPVIEKWVLAEKKSFSSVESLIKVN